MAENDKKAEVRECPKDCKRCSMAQQVFCSAQMSFTSFEVMNRIIGRIDALEETIKGFQGTKEMLNDPLMSIQGRDEVFEIGE